MPLCVNEAGGAMPKKKPTVLVVDDDPVVRVICHKFLTDHGYAVVEAASCAEAERALAARPQCAVLDYQLPDGDALALLPRLHAVDPQLAVIMLTAHGSIELAVEAMRLGAEHFLTKPLDPETLETVIARCLKRRRDRRRRVAVDARRGRSRANPFLGTSGAVRWLEQRAGKFAGTERPVLLLGETGTGKGVLARWLHDRGPRAEEPFVDLSCAGLKPELLESELFGHEKGAFTGASSAKPGLVEVADHGTLFLDEVGDMDPAIQPKLLKVLEEQRLRRLGDVRDRPVDVRLVAATQRELRAMVRRQEFRSDLYFRLHTLTLEIPPLRKRWEDIPPLAEHLLEQLGKELSRPGLGLSPSAVKALVSYPWPGNIRELRNVLERAVLLGDGSSLERADIDFDSGLTDAAQEAKDTLELNLRELEKRHIERVLEHESGSVSRAAERLGVPRSTLYKKLKKYGIELPSGSLE